MAENNDQGPHYIPELDPDHPARSENDPGQRALWRWFLISVALLLLGGALFALGLPGIGVAVMILGILALAPFVFFIGW